MEGGASAFAANRYVQAIDLVGGAPVSISPLEDEISCQAIYERLEGLLLPGGGDINPRHYREEKLCKLRNPSDRRDNLELTLVRWALQDGLPILAICRGLQVLNVALRGTLYQDIASQLTQPLKHDCSCCARDYLAHEIEIEPQTYLAATFGDLRIHVNSRHHQAIKEAAPGLTVSARAPDGIIEALEGVGPAFVLGIQFHPEDLVANDERMQRLFSSFVEAANAPRTVL